MDADPVKFYSYGALNTNGFAGRFFDCPEPGGPGNPKCLQYSGDFQLRANGIALKIWQDIVALICLCGVFYLMAGVLFSMFPVKIKMSKKPTTAFSDFKNSGSIGETTSKEVQGMEILLKDYVLDLQRVRPWGRVFSEKTIINQLSTTFKPGTLNVIMLVSPLTYRTIL